MHHKSELSLKMNGSFYGQGPVYAGSQMKMVSRGSSAYGGPGAPPVRRRRRSGTDPPQSLGRTAQERPKGEATKQRAPEQPIVCASQRRKGLHEDVMLSQRGLSHNGANCSLWSRLPVAYVVNIVFGKTLGYKSVEIRNWYDTLQNEA